jgi:hypothetical protein
VIAVSVGLVALLRRRARPATEAVAA